MTCSPARLANASKSRGPKTEAGEAASRANPSQHGPTGAGVVLPTEDGAEVGRRFASIFAELDPVGDLGACLARRVALMTVRLDRSGRHEAAALAERVRGAEAAFDEARLAEVDRLIRDIAEDPAAHVRALRRMPEGIDRMLATWAALRSDLAQGAGALWSGIHRQIADELTGRHADATTLSPLRALSQAFYDAYNSLKPGEGPEIAAATARRESARDRLIEAIDAEIAGLHAARASLDLEALALDRAGAADRALFDPSKDAILARKYEAATERSLYRALRELRELREAPPVTPPPEPEPEPVEAPAAAPLASFCPEPPADRRDPAAPPSTGVEGEPTPLDGAVRADVC